MVLKCLPPIDEYHGNFLVKLRVGGAFFENIDFPKLERLQGAQFAELSFDGVAEATPGLGEEDDFHMGVQNDSKSKGGEASRWDALPPFPPHAW